MIALCLQSVAVMDQQATFTDTSTRISSMEIALWGGGGGTQLATGIIRSDSSASGPKAGCIKL